MEDTGSFGPSVVVAVGVDPTDVEQLQDLCAARKHRLIVASRQTDLPLSIQCDHAVIGTLLPDGDGRRLATEFVRAGASVIVLENAGPVPLLDVWTLGASAAKGKPSDWLDVLADVAHVEAVARAGRLMEALRLADSVESLASFSASTGVPSSLVRIQPEGNSGAELDQALDKLTSVVGMTTVFYDTPGGERIALVVNGDRRRLMRLLEDKQLSTTTHVSVVELRAGDDLPALIGRSRLDLRRQDESVERPRVLVAVGAGHDKVSETLRSALHRADFTPVFWDAAFRFDDPRGNGHEAVILDAGLPGDVASMILESAIAQDPPIPVVAVSDAEDVGAVKVLVDAGASDFLIWPFSLGEVQASVARAVTDGSEMLKAAAADRLASQAVESEAPWPEASEIESEPVLEEVSEIEQDPEPAEALEAELEPLSEAGNGSGSNVARPGEFEAGVIADAGVTEELTPDADPAGERSVRVEVALAELIGQHLAAGEPVNLEGLGVLSVRHETSRIIHDEEGRTIVEPPRRSLSFQQANPSDGVEPAP
ncbi:MAG TPA: hypothetical protein VMO47_15485 [Rhodothermales bacterium]|nr:hypothetical protein [Rhodothermales bacterium]